MPYIQGLPYGYGWAPGADQSRTTPEAERDYFQRVINSQGVEFDPTRGLYFNDPGNNRGLRTWYNEYGQIVKQPGVDTGGPLGHYEREARATPGGGISKILGDMTLQRIAKTFDWQKSGIPIIHNTGGGGYYWSHDPNTFAVPRPPQPQGIPNLVQQLVAARGGGGGADEPEVADPITKYNMTPEERMRRKDIKRRPHKVRPQPSPFGGGGGGGAPFTSPYGLDQF